MQSFSRIESRQKAKGNNRSGKVAKTEFLQNKLMSKKGSFNQETMGLGQLGEGDNNQCLP